MVKITASDIRHLAVLSGLSLDDDEVKSLRLDIDRVVEYIGELDELDVSGVEPTYQVTDPGSVMRADEVDQSEASREELLELAPDFLDNQIRVPKVL